MGIFGQRAPLPISTPFATPESMETGVAPAQGRGVFGRGSFGRDLVGALADRLAINGGMTPAYAQSLAQERELQKYKMQQADELAQYERKQQIEAKYRTQQPNDTERDYGFILQQAGPDAANQWLRNRYDPIVTVDEVGTNGATIRSFRPRSELTGQPVNPPQTGDSAPSSEEYGRFVQSLDPSLRDRAWQAYNSGQLGNLPLGSPLSPSGRATPTQKRPTFTIKSPPKTETPKPRSGTLKIGTVMGAYEYIGGDPKSQNSWRKK